MEGTPLRNSGSTVYAAMVGRQSLGGSGGPKITDQRIIDITCGLLGTTLTQKAQFAVHTHADRMPKVSV